MQVLRCLRLASIVGVLACGADEPVVGGEPEPKDHEESPAGSVDAGAGGGGTDASRDARAGNKTPVEGPVVSRDPPKKDGGTENCGEEMFRTGPAVPDIMIVLDRSGSMKPDARLAMVRCDNLNMLDPLTQLTRFAECAAAGIDCNSDRDRNTVNCGGTMVRVVDRWTPSVAAIKKITAEFNADVGFGLITFPGQASGGGGNNTCTPGTLQVPLGLNKADAIAMVLDRTQPGGGTPTGQALATALEEFNKNDAADQSRSARYVLLVTDGQPTCPNGRGNGDNAGADKKLTLDAIDALAKADIKTFVIGYDAALDPQFATSLTEFAQHGGTERYYAVQDEMSLGEALKTISSAVIECKAELSSSFVVPEDVHVILDGKELPLNDPDGWRIEGKTVLIEGQACATLQSGKGHKIDVVVDCQMVH